MDTKKKTRNIGHKQVVTKDLPSFMQPTESSSKKTREKIFNPCAPRRLTVSYGNGMCSFGDARIEYDKQEAPSRRRKKTASASVEDVPRYMQQTESSSKKSLGEKYKLRPPRNPSGSSRNNLSTPKGEPQRIQMSNVAMSPFVESLRRGAVSDRTDLDRPELDRRQSSRLMRSLSKESSETDTTSEGWLRETRNLPRYQQPTVLSSLRANGRTRA